MWQNSKTKIGTKPKNQIGTTQKLKFWQTQKIKMWQLINSNFCQPQKQKMWQLKNSNCDKTQNVGKLKNSNYDKTQKLKLGRNSKHKLRQNSKTQLLTTKFMTHFKKSFVKNSLTPWQLMRCTLVSSLPEVSKLKTKTLKCELNNSNCDQTQIVRTQKLKVWQNLKT